MSSLYPSRWREDPQPLGRSGELAIVAAGVLVLAACLAALAGFGVACAVFGRGWVWPPSTETAAHLLGGLLRGHPGRGLPPRLIARAPGVAAAYGCIMAGELAVAAILVTVVVLVLRYHQPRDARGGMATRAQAAQVLGASRLRAVAAIIRPDLYDRPRTRVGAR